MYYVHDPHKTVLEINIFFFNYQHMINILMVPSDYEMEIGDIFFIQFFLNYIKLLNNEYEGIL